MFLTRKTPVAAVLFVSAIFASVSIARQPQTPSQRFSPERTVPPSVHVPDAGASRLGIPNGPGYRPNIRSTSMNFSDTPATAFSNQEPGLRQPSATNRSTRQVSYNQDVPSNKSRLPNIPAVLRGNTQTPKSRLSATQPEQLSQSLRPPARNDVTQSGGKIVVDEKKFENHKRDIESRLNELKQLRMEADAPSQSNPRNPNLDVQQVVFLQNTSPDASGISNNDKSSSATVPVQTADFNSRPSLNSNLNSVRQVSAESEAITGATLKLTTPGIRVEAIGPNSTGINKIATYKITITNTGGEDAENIIVGVDLPDSIDLQNINVSAGHHEITDGIERSRLVWTVERVSAETTHTIAINAIPRTADPFEMGVKWSFAPRAGTTLVQVTEPQLEMVISGPTEVLFGEKATYDVSVVNPGTGDAERVSVMLPEALGGERASIGDVPAGGEKNFKVELFARTAGMLNLTATAVGEGNIQAEASHDILVRRANLQIAIDGPPMKYAGSISQYTVTISNDGDATASDVAAVLALPNGVKYLGGISNAESSDGGLKWTIGTMTSGDHRTFKLNCQLDSSGDLLFQAGARGAGELAATSDCQTHVETIADLTLNVEDPQGPLPTGEDITYQMTIRNRGTRSANGVNLVMQFSEGIEPFKAKGFKNKIVTGQVIFSPISRIEPGQEIVLNVTAKALKSGTHIFRAQLTCEDSDSREIAEGTTRFFGDDVAADTEQIMLPSKANTADASDDVSAETNDFK